ncbi:MAG: radical SAM protein [Phycisphaerae bacterium]|nr:radical SAM protein [Phycisphaerae bacterium]
MIDSYQGFEQGPIRPPSEASSLLIRVTRNCPWNRCTFCPVYKGAKFSIRPVEDVKRDIDSIHAHVETLQQMADETGHIHRDEVIDLADGIGQVESQSLTAAFNWLFAGGMKSIFLQDANTLVIKPSDLVEILKHIKTSFPSVERITSYARSHTLALRRDDDLKAIRDAGLTRIHVGMESGSDRVLERVGKGVTKGMHIKAAIKAKEAGFELSEYVMPGLGGRELSQTHALETADALNQMNPDFIRFRTLAIPPGTPLHEDQAAGRFEKCTDLMVARELLLFIENLNGITSVIESDHILNLFEDLRGALPRDKGRMIGILRTFLEMAPERRTLYQVGRRLGVFSRMSEMDDPRRLARAERTCRELGIAPENADEITDEIVKRFV